MKMNNEQREELHRNQRPRFDGTITLGTAGSKVHVGLPYNADLQTLPLSMEMQAFCVTAATQLSSLQDRRAS